MRKFLYALSFCTALYGQALALEIPRSSDTDENMKVAVYSPLQRYLIVGLKNRGTMINFSPEETIVRIDFGATDTWDCPSAESLQNNPLHNHIPIWPKATEPTNLQIITTRPDGTMRPYQFDLLVQEKPKCISQEAGALQICRDPNLTYGLTFVYPDDQKAAAAKVWQARQQQRQEDTATARLKVDVFYGVRNWNYLARGDAILMPSETSDNRRITGLRYPGNATLPAVFSVSSDNSEHTILPNMVDDVATFPVRARAFVLRQGNSVAEIYNCDGISYALCASAAEKRESFVKIPFSTPGPDPRTGTTSPEVIRSIKRAPGTLQVRDNR
jgi:type IV secretion system protein VirB9